MAEKHIRLNFGARDRSRGPMRAMERNVGALAGRIKRMGASIGRAMLGATLGVAGLGAAFAKLMQGHSRQVDAETRLEAVLRSTGGAVGFNIEELKAYARELQTELGVGDEAILEMMARAAAFTGITGDNFKELIRLSINLADHMGGDLVSAMSSIARAMLAPGENMRGLRDVGIHLTDDLERQLITMTRSGDAAGAQAVLMKELALRIGEVSEKVRQTPRGRWRAMKSEIGDAAEAIGGAIYDGLELGKVMELIRERAASFGSGLQKRLTPHIEEAGKALRMLGGDEATAAEGMKILKRKVGELGEVIRPHAEKAGQVIGKGMVDGIGSYLGKGFLRHIIRQATMQPLADIGKLKIPKAIKDAESSFVDELASHTLGPAANITSEAAFLNRLFGKPVHVIIDNPGTVQ